MYRSRLEIDPVENVKVSQFHNQFIASHATQRNRLCVRSSLIVTFLLSSFPDALYRTSVENLEQARQQWEREMTNICNVSSLPVSFAHFLRQTSKTVLSPPLSLSSLVSLTRNLKEKLSLAGFPTTRRRTDLLPEKRNVGAHKHTFSNLRGQ